MPSNIPTASRVHSIPLYGGDSAYDSTSDADGDSFSFSESDKHLGSSSLHANIPQTYHRPISPRAPRRVTSYCKDDEIGTTDSEDGYRSRDSTDDLLSLDSAIHVSKNSCNRSDNLWEFDGLSSFPFFAKPSPHSHPNALEKYTVSSSIPSLSGNKSSTSDSIAQCSQASQSLSEDLSDSSNNSFEQAIDLENNSATRFRGNDRNFDLTLSRPSCAALDNSLRLNRSTSERSDTKMLKMGRSFSTSTTYASTLVNSNSLRSSHTAASSGGYVPDAVTFANECMQRSLIRRSSEDSSRSDLSRTASDASYFPNAASYESSSIAPSLTPSQESIEPSPISLSEAMRTVQVVDLMLDDMSHSSHSNRLQEIKRRLRSMEIQYYRRKCVWSLRKSMAHYMIVDAANDIIIDCDDSTVFSEISVCQSQFSRNGRIMSIRQSVIEMAWEIMLFNLVISMICMLYFNEDSIYKFAHVLKIRRLMMSGLVPDSPVL